jgi:hypothetical protein
MALSQTIQISGRAFVSSDGFTVDVGDQTALFDAYIKVKAVRATKETGNAIVSFAGVQGCFEKTYDFTPSMDGGNFIKQAYLYLKSLPEFADAVDC